MDTKPATYGVRPAAEILGIGKDTLYRAISRKEIPVSTVGASIRIPRWWIEQQIAPPADAS